MFIICDVGSSVFVHVLSFTLQMSVSSMTHLQNFTNQVPYNFYNMNPNLLQQMGGAVSQMGVAELGTKMMKYMY